MVGEQHPSPKRRACWFFHDWRIYRFGIWTQVPDLYAGGDAPTEKVCIRCGTRKSMTWVARGRI